LLGGISEMLDAARRVSARTVNALMTASYWEIGRRIVEFEQGGAERADYGKRLVERLSRDLTARFGRGFGQRNVEGMRRFYLALPAAWVGARLAAQARLKIPQTPSAEFDPVPPQIPQTLSAECLADISETRSGKSSSGAFGLRDLTQALPLPWSHYVLLVRRARSPEALDFYHTEALRGGWSVRTLDRQMSTLFYERTALSRDKAKMLAKHAKARPCEALSAVEAVRDPCVLEFLGLKDDYSETDLEEALVQHLQQFLLELGDDWAFVDRQRRLRLDSQWYRVDLLFFHRALRCLVVIDLKLGKFTHADAGQMHLYLNYAREHWTRAGENPPIGLILCSTAEADVVRYSLEGLSNKVLAAECRLTLPDEKKLLAELRQTRRAWDLRQALRTARPQEK
jgi:predicted nuclease of restriction endonuclease-like (RecB) superfamily